MGTRGLYGFKKDGIEKIQYCHFDSYPEGLGENVVYFINNSSQEEMEEIFEKIIMVNESDSPSSLQVEECIRWSNMRVGNQSLKDWYCLLREAQGVLMEFKNGLKYMIDNKNLIKSHTCEWMYIIDLDDKLFKVFNYNKIESLSLVNSFELKDIPENWISLLFKDEDDIEDVI